jgi:hypothetical protein
VTSEVEVTAFDQNNRRQLSTGTLLLIDNIIDQATATLRLKAMFANTDERLWPGEFVNARVLLETLVLSRPLRNMLGHKRQASDAPVVEVAFLSRHRHPTPSVGW